MKNFKGSSLLITALVFSSLFTASTTQGAEKKKPAVSVPSETQPPPDHHRKIGELQLTGMSLNGAIGVIREQYPEINFIPPLNGGELTIDLVLRSVNLPEILKALELACDGFLKIQRPDPRLVVFQVSSGPKVNRSSARVFNMSGYLADKTEAEAEKAIANLYDAIEIAWQMMRSENADSGQSKPPQMRLHAGTKLLIAAGGVEELDILDQVVREVQGQGHGSASAWGGGSAPFIGGQMRNVPLPRSALPGHPARPAPQPQPKPDLTGPKPVPAR